MQLAWAGTGSGIHERSAMVQKLRVVVRVDLGSGSAMIKVLGKLDLYTLIGLYSLIRRTNSIRPGLTVEVDLRGAATEAAALADLRAVCAAGAPPAAGGARPAPRPV